MLVEKPMTVKLADAEAIAAAATRRPAVPRPSRYGWNYSRLAIWAKEMLEAGRIGRVTSVTGYKASSLTDLFSGRAGYGVVDVGGFQVEVEAKTWARAGRRRRLPLRPAVAPARARPVARAGRAGGRLRARELPARTGATSTSRSRSGSPTA